MKKFRKIRDNLRLKKIGVLEFCSSLVLSFRMNPAKEMLKNMLKNIRRSYTLYEKKFVTL
nr:MAG TPA: hypothetical protein [Caudoviricetes sp.]